MRQLFLLFLILILLPSISSAENAGVFDAPDTGFVSNVAIDIVASDGIIWLATDDGINYSLDSGKTWLSYGEDNGLVSDNVSAMFYMSGRIYVALNHTEIIAGEATSISDGISYSDDLGDNWEQVDFEQFDLLYATGGDRTIFDITGYDQRIFAAAFAGGVLATADDGNSWYRLFPSKKDSINYYQGHIGLDTLSLLNRYFSARVDTSHLYDPTTLTDDSLYVWVGTAGGLVQFVFIDPHAKASSKRISGIVVSDSNSVIDHKLVYWGGERGVTQSARTGNSYKSWFGLNDLTYDNVTAVGYADEDIFVGTLDETGTKVTLAMTDATWENFQNIEDMFTDPTGESYISEFKQFRDRYFMSAGHAGLWLKQSPDSSWTQVMIDSTDTASAVNNSYGIAGVGDTMYIGTDTGLVVAFFDAGSVTLDSFFVQHFPETDSSSTKITKLKIQEFADSLILWSIHEPNANGTGFVGRNNITRLREIDSWRHLQVDAVVHDFAFKGDTAFVAGEESIRFNTMGYNPNTAYKIVKKINDIVVDSLSLDTVTAMVFDDAYVYIGTTNGFAISVDSGKTYDITRVVTDPQKPDLALKYNIANSLLNFTGGWGITGNWMPAIDIQYKPDSAAHVWLSTRSTGQGGDNFGFGISRGRIISLVNESNDTLQERYWELMYYDDFAWNFGFNGDTVFAATNSGLLVNTTGNPLEWDTVQFIDSEGVPQILENVPVYAVEVFGDYVWVGTDDRMLRLSLDDLTVETTFFVHDTLTSQEEVYAFPVPFSHTSDYGVDFHFTVEKDANITLKIYDFAMNPVKTVFENKFYAAGTYPTSGSNREVWDGMNGKGDKVAVGMYYFKVEYSTGEIRWGKLVVIP